ncbi:MAG TPA: hypothetical protein VMS92_19210 [Mycobacterium sp.]|nr:hypothetical protein [Mycobacterium sp.]
MTARIKAATLAALVAVVCAACGSTTTESAGPIVPVSIDCGMQVPGRGGADGLTAEIPGFTVSEICPADVDPSFGTAAFDGLAAGLVSQNGNPILRVLAGQLKSGSGDDFIRTYHGNLSAQARDGVGVPSETEELGGHVVTHFNIPLVTDGYVYAKERTVVIAYVASGSPPATVESALTEILDNLG